MLRKSFRGCGQTGGQALTESVLLLPLFLVLALGMLQLGQLGIAVVVTHYAASSVARKAVSDNTFSSGPIGVPLNLISIYTPKAKALMSVGMQLVEMKACRDPDPSTPTADLTVLVRTKISAWPFFGDIVHASLGDSYDAPVLTTCQAQGNGFFNLSPAPAPYYFYITGKAIVRLNYVQ